jgi:hypothetical protein
VIFLVGGSARLTVPILSPVFVRILVLWRWNPGILDSWYVLGFCCCVCCQRWYTCQLIAMSSGYTYLMQPLTLWLDYHLESIILLWWYRNCKFISLLLAANPSSCLFLEESMLAFLVSCQWQCILRFPHPRPILCIGGVQVFIIMIISVDKILTLNIIWVDWIIGIFVIFFTTKISTCYMLTGSVSRHYSSSLPLS